MGFQFPLATVLRVRKIVEEREERLLQQILFDIAQTRKTLEGVRNGIDGSDASLRASIHQLAAGHDLHAAYGEKHQLKQSQQDLEARLEKLEQLKEQQVGVYEAARRNREMLTDMRQEQRNEYDSSLAKREQKTLDDNYIARRGRSG